MPCHSTYIRVERLLRLIVEGEMGELKDHIDKEDSPADIFACHPPMIKMGFCASCRKDRPEEKLKFYKGSMRCDICRSRSQKWRK